MRRRGSGLLLLLIVSITWPLPVRADDAADAHFRDRAWPLLESRCVGCHGPDERKGGLRLDAREHLLKGGEHGAAVVLGKPAESLLIRSVRHEVSELSMPPKEKLSDTEVATLERWVRDGIPWPKIPEPSPAAPAQTGERIGNAWTDPRNPIRKLFGGERIDLWSLRPIEAVSPPALGDATNGQPSENAIDRFVLARLAARGGIPAPEADRRTLARRLAYDLTGLPPAADLLRTYLADSSPEAYERLVDALLASPRYGEHQARWWLDVVRYSDSNGFDWDEFRPQAWRYRDYVVRAFNDDKPFDRFVVEQLAGDELLAGSPQTLEDQQTLLATGYLRMGPQDNAAGLFNEQTRARAELMADLVETTGSAFLGLTFSCCRCHDHKYDPLSQADHFRLRAFFEAVRYGDEIPLDLAEQQEAIRTHNAALDEKIQKSELEKAKILEGAKERLQAGKPPASEAASAEKSEQSEEEIKKALTEAEQKQVASLQKRIAGWNKKRRSFEHALLMSDSKDDVAATHVLYQGDYRSPREAVVPGVLSALDPNPAEVTAPPNPATTGRRLALAHWITAAENPLTSRVIVNRVWQNLFGRGLVTTPNDFGLAGSRPTHPELLDWLASDLVRSGWSLKALQRRIVLSATYRQSSVPATGSPLRDAENSLLGHQNLRRLSAEQLRDSLLAVSGLLTDKTGGPPVWPDLPSEILQANPAFLDDNATKTKGWYPSPPPEQNARSLFVVQKRTVRVPFLETFDLPENLTSCPCRNSSTVAPQALTLLNSPLGTAAARGLAQRIEAEGPAEPREQVVRLYELALQRSPTNEESSTCETFLKERSLVELCRVVLNLNEFAFRD